MQPNCNNITMRVTAGIGIAPATNVVYRCNKVLYVVWGGKSHYIVFQCDSSGWIWVHYIHTLPCEACEGWVSLIAVNRCSFISPLVSPTFIWLLVCRCSK